MTRSIRVCRIEDINKESVIRFDIDDNTYAIFHAPDGKFYATA